MKSFFRIFLCLFLLTILVFSGCTGYSDTNIKDSGVDVSEGIKQEVFKYGEIADPTELENLWQEYLYDSANLVGISRNFSNVKEIDPLFVAQFCWLKYINEHEVEKLEVDHEGSYLRLFPLDIVHEYAKRYFDLEELDISQIDEGNYDPEKKAFLFSPGGKRQPPRPS
ncbi:MAG: hypothetical protein ACOYJ1_09835, partial [Peptococcales bacterium]